MHVLGGAGGEPFYLRERVGVLYMKGRVMNAGAVPVIFGNPTDYHVFFPLTETAYISFTMLGVS